MEIELPFLFVQLWSKRHDGNCERLSAGSPKGVKSEFRGKMLIISPVSVSSHFVSAEYLVVPIELTISSDPCHMACKIFNGH